jgi:hypothetical protein
MAADLQEQAVQVEWKAAKITAAALKGLIEQILANREKITHGEQSLKKLNLQGKKLESIELTGEDMQAFKRELNKYAVDFSIKKDTETQNYTVFFKGQDVDRVYKGLQKCVENFQKGSKKPISKKFIVIVALVGVLVLAAAIVVAVLHKNSNPAISIVGTWYSDKPDSVTFGKEGNYSFAEWNGGNPWLSFAGTYSVSGNTVTLQSAQDGTTTLTINQAQDGSYTLTGKYTYYQTEEAAKAALTAAAAQAAEDEANIIPNTVNKLLGEWTSLDGTTTCSFTETGITVHTAATNVLPEEMLYHEYEIISDKLIKIVKSGAAANYPYTLTESSDGVMTFYCTGIEYAPTYTKGTLSVQERAERYKAVYGIYPYNYNQSINNNTDNTITDRVISSERNPDVSEYARELDAYVKDMIVGTWKGTFDEWPTADSIYWSYTFSADGTYSFTNGTTTEAGTYAITSDPNNNYYHSSMQLTFDGGERTMQFYFTTTNPVKMITDDQTDPTYLKSLV